MVPLPQNGAKFIIQRWMLTQPIIRVTWAIIGSVIKSLWLWPLIGTVEVDNAASSALHS